MSNIVPNGAVTETAVYKHSFTPAGFGSGLSGMWRAILAFLNNYNSVENYSTNGLMALSATVQTQGETAAYNWIGTLQADEKRIQDVQPSDPNYQTLVSQYTAQFNMDNVAYNQSSTFFSGLDNGVNQNSSDTTNTLQVDLQMYQNGPLAEQQTLASVL